MSSRRPFFVIRPRSFDRPRRGRRRDGFALLITITLLAFLVLLLVSLASLTRVETQVASNSQSVAQARQNALMALNLALGQLQKHAGPDQRVTARADVLAPSGFSWTVVSPSPPPAAPPAPAQYAGARTADQAALNTYWLARRNRQWTGVWRNRNTPEYPQVPAAAPYSAAAPASFNPVPALGSWLVSGNENSATGDLYKPTDAVTGLSESSTAFDRILDASGKPHRLLVKAGAGVATAADLDRAVTAPEIEIRSTDTPGNGGTDTAVGHYAWWIGDEGVKARANLADAYAAEGAVEADRTRFQSAQRPAIEAMTASGSDGLAPLAPPAASGDLADFQAALGKVFLPSQLGLVGPAATLSSELKTRFHDLSVSSRGVLADAKHGGLKTDLTYLFGQTDLTAFRTALNAAYGTTVAPNATANSVFSAAATPYATLPADVGGAPAYGASPGIFTNSSTWEQLRSFHNLGNLTTAAPAGAYNATGEVVPRRQNDSRHGVHPMIMQAKLFYGLRADNGTLKVDITPVVVLANPYNVKLAPEDYVILFDNFQPRVRFGATTGIADAGYTPTAPATTTPGQIVVNKVFTAKTRFVLRSDTGMEAGKAYVFTIDPSGPGVSGDRFPFDASNAKEVILKNDFYPLTTLTYDTGVTLPYTVAGVPKPYAALTGGTAPMTAALYIKSDYAGADDAQKGIHYVFGQGTSDPSTNGTFFLVEPVASGESKVGGGVILVLNEPPTGAPDNYRAQQAPFYQVNYRAPWINYSASNSAINHPVEWARAFTKHGSTAGGNPFNPWLAAHLMLRGPSDFTTRWGIVNYGSNSSQDNVAPRTLVPQSIGGAAAGDVGFENYLYDFPRPGRPPASLGQLEHFNTAGFIAGTSSYNQGSAAYNANIVHAWQVNYAISNSYPHPRVPRDQVFFSSAGFSYHYDGSYLWNDLLWDRFYFSSYPQSGAFDFATDKLVNNRLRPFRDKAQVAWNDPAGFRGDGNPATAANSRAAAQNLLVDGAFNINSTSVEAWKAVFSSLKKVPVHTGNGAVNNSTAPFSRTLHPLGGSTQAETGVQPASWNGFRDLTSAQIQSLAEEMALQVRKRGPFLSLSEFVNRRLVATAADTAPVTNTPGLGLSGALQSSLDRVINQRNEVTAPFTATTNTSISTAPANALQENAYIQPYGLAGFPGHLLQGDVLSALGSSLSARSDTFTIRTYGDTVNPATGDVIGRAWCEAVVQRVPDYLVPASVPGGNDPHQIPSAGTANEKFGRRFQIVGFRWLSSDEI